MARPSPDDLIASFADADGPQDGAERLYRALGPWEPRSLVLTDAHRPQRDKIDWDETARVMAPALVERPDIVAAADRLFPLTVATRRMRRPFVWSEMGPDFASAADEATFWKLGRSLMGDRSDGLAMPRFRDGWLVAVLTLGFAEPAPSGEARDAIVAAGEAFVARFSADVEFRPLTKREGECLHWVGEGKTDVEIGIILDLSPATVRSYVESARVKLGARNRVEAVARHLVSTKAEARRGHRVKDLSLREHVCLFRALYGATDEEIAANLGLSPATVHDHIENAKRKLGVRTRAQAIAELARRGGL